MSKSFKVFIHFAILGIFLLGGLVAQQPPADNTRAKGLIPLDSQQMEEIINTWPRIEKVNFNWLGFERVNRVKARKGKDLLDSFSIKPVGQETESAVRAIGAPIQIAGLNEDLVGDLPVYVDNSSLQYFPPIRNQGTLGSCASFASTYYQLSYMTAFLRGLDISDDGDNTNKYSPKWTYNMLNSGLNDGTYINQNYFLLARHGAATWAEFPYDTDYRAWCLDTTAWRNALNVKSNTYQYVYYTHTDSSLEVIKELLTNGYILVFGTYITSWQNTVIPDDPLTPDDDPAVGKYVGYWVNGTEGSHAMTIVGYNDAIWTDINENGTIDAGEKGALRIANSWGTGWNPDDGGFTWLAYDALKSISAVTGGPSTGRVAAFQGNAAFAMTARDNYSPSMIAEFTVNHAKRSQLELTLGLSNSSSTTPTMLWTSWMLRGMGGAYAFDGTTTAVDGTFVFDFTDLLIAGGDLRRYYLSMKDSDSGDEATLAAYKIIDTTTDPDTEVVYAPDPPLPLVIDNSQVYPYVEYMYLGDAVNEIPSVWNPQVSPASGTSLDTYTYAIEYIDADGDAPSVKNVFIDETPHDMTFASGTASNGWYIYQTSLDIGIHNYRFYFEDGRGGVAQNPLLSGTISGPVVVLPHIITTPNTPSGEQSPTMGTPYAYSTGGSTCNQGHDIQYQFDWGDGTMSDWLAVGVISTAHTWSSPGSFSVRAQARCAVSTTVLSPWSSSLTVSITTSLPFTEDFTESATGWAQQNIGSGIGTQWYLYATNYAGGSPAEARCEYASVNPGTTRLITPQIDTTGLSSVRLSFKHFLDAWGTGAQLKIQTSPDMSTWTDEAWVIDTTASNIGPETVETVLTNNLNISTTYVAFVITGDLYQYDYWYIDDVSITRAISPKVDFNNDGQEDILWRYYGAGGRDRAWFLGNTDPGAQPLYISDSPMEESSPAIRRRGAAAKMTMSEADMGMVGRKGGVSVKDPKDAVPPGTWRAALSPAVNSSGKAGVSLPEMDAHPLRPGVQNPGYATSDVNPSGTSSGLIEIAAATGVLGGADILAVPDLTWHAMGTGDFNNDGKTDVLWRYNGTGGRVRVWYMDGTSVIAGADIGAVSDLEWQIVGTGDFNEDGNVDLLWHHGVSGRVRVWYLDGISIIAGADISTVSDLNWKVMGTGDFNSDGHVDILWRHSVSGRDRVWFMDGLSILSGADLIAVTDQNWQIAGTGDYNGDGHIDVIWRYNGSGGYVYIWYLNGTSWIGTEKLIAVTDLNWKIVSR